MGTEQYNKTIVAKADELCAKCIANAQLDKALHKKVTMLCSGFRPTHDEDASSFYGMYKVSNKPCRFLQEKMQEEEYAYRFDLTMLPRSVIGKIQPKHYNFSNGNPLVLSVSKEHSEDLIGYTLGVIKENLIARWVYPPVFYGAYQGYWNELGSVLVNHTDVLIVDSIDYSQGPDFKRLAFMSAVSQRILLDLPTIVSISDRPVATTEMEKDLFKELDIWKKQMLSNM